MLRWQSKVYFYVIKDKNPIQLDQLTVRGSSIRYVILPETLQLDALLVEEENKVKKAKVPTKRTKKPRKEKKWMIFCYVFVFVIQNILTF